MVHTLLADMGGTNIRFAVNDGKKTGAITHFKCADFNSFSQALTAFSKTLSRLPKHFVLGVPTPCKSDTLFFTNNPWHFKISAVRSQFGFNTFQVVNDFEAQAMAIPFLKKADVQPIGKVVSGCPNAPRIILGAGTGLGMGILLTNRDGSFRSLSSEGGHITAAASNEKEEKIIHFARQRFARVSAERLISGAGLSLLYEFESGRKETPEFILQHALSQDKAAMAALLQMFAFWGTVSGEMALTLGATGGVYLSGGIIQADGVIDILEKSDFRPRFENKGRHQEYVSKIPTFAITQKDTAFLGLAAFGKNIDAKK